MTGLPFFADHVLSLFEKGLLTLSQTAQILGISLEECIELLDEAGIPAVDYPAEELDEDLQTALP